MFFSVLCPVILLVSFPFFSLPPPNSSAFIISIILKSIHCMQDKPPFWKISFQLIYILFKSMWFKKVEYSTSTSRENLYSYSQLPTFGLANTKVEILSPIFFPYHCCGSVSLSYFNTFFTFHCLIIEAFPHTYT